MSMPLDSIRSTARSNSTLASASIPLLVVGAAARIGRLNLRDEHPHALLLGVGGGAREPVQCLARLSRQARGAVACAGACAAGAAVCQSACSLLEAMPAGRQPDKREAGNRFQA